MHAVLEVDLEARAALALEVHGGQVVLGLEIARHGRNQIQGTGRQEMPAVLQAEGHGVAVIEHRGNEDGQKQEGPEPDEEILSRGGERPALDLSRLIDPSGRKELPEPISTRRVWFDGWHEVPVYWRDSLPLKINLQGPAIIEQMDTTIVIDPGAWVGSDRDGNLIIEVNK